MAAHRVAKQDHILQTQRINQIPDIPCGLFHTGIVRSGRISKAPLVKRNAAVFVLEGVDQAGFPGNTAAKTVQKN